MYLRKVSLTAPWWENWRRQTLGTEKIMHSSRFHDNRRVWTKNPGVTLYSFLPLRLTVKLKHRQVPSLKYILQPSVQYPAACFTWMTAWPPNSGVCCTPTPQLSYSLSQHGSQSYPCTVVGYTVSLSRSAPPTHHGSLSHLEEQRLHHGLQDPASGLGKFSL